MNTVAKFENLKDLIVEVRGQSVLLDNDVAELYRIETKRINEAVKNNPDKFPHDYMFEISEGEFVDLRSKFSTTKFAKTRSLPKAFRENAQRFVENYSWEKRKHGYFDLVDSLTKK